MTSTLEKILSLIRFSCASAEACRRSGKDDCAQNAEDSIVQFCARGVTHSSLRCATRVTSFAQTVSCFAVQWAPVWPTRGGKRVGVMHGRRAYSCTPAEPRMRRPPPSHATLSCTMPSAGFDRCTRNNATVRAPPSLRRFGESVTVAYGPF